MATTTITTRPTTTTARHSGHVLGYVVGPHGGILHVFGAICGVLLERFWGPSGAFDGVSRASWGQVEVLGGHVAQEGFRGSFEFSFWGFFRAV